MPLNIPKEEKHIFYNKTIRLPDNIIEQIEQISIDTNISFNKVVNYLIEYALKEVIITPS